MDLVSPYRFTIIGGVVVLVLSAGIVTVVGGPQNASPYLQLVGAVAVPGLLGLFRLEKNTRELSERHQENTAKLDATEQKIDELRTVLKDAIAANSEGPSLH